MKVLKITAITILSLATHLHGQNNSMYTVHANQEKASIAPTMWGVFFEDINMGADGGIYAELVKNRSFEFFKPLMGWTIQRKQFVEGDILVLNRKETNSANPRFLRVTAKNAVKGDLQMINEGFRGMGIKKGLRYDFSVMYRQQTPGVKLHVELLNAAGKGIGDTVLIPSANDNAWHKQAVSFHSSDTALKAKMNL